jgi:hypothetical protein
VCPVSTREYLKEPPHMPLKLPLEYPCEYPRVNPVRTPLQPHEARHGRERRQQLRLARARAELADAPRAVYVMPTHYIKAHHSVWLLDCVLLLYYALLHCGVVKYAK